MWYVRGQRISQYIPLTAQGHYSLCTDDSILMMLLFAFIFLYLLASYRLPTPSPADILRHSKSDPMLTSPTSREVMRSQQMAIARRLVSLQACGQQRYLQLRGRHSVEEDFPGQGGQNNRHEQDHEDDKRDEDEEAVEDDVSIAPTIEQIKDDYNSCFS